MSSNAVSNPATSTENVLNTIELLEHILNFLPMPQALGKSRVSQTWKAVIDNSPVLQKKLFLRHNGNQAEVISVDHLFPMPQNLRQILPQNLNSGQRAVVDFVHKPVYTTPIELNPLMGLTGQGGLTGLHVSHEMRAYIPTLSFLSLAGFEVMTGKYNRTYVRHRFDDSWQTTQAVSSWRNMYLTSPPITDVALDVPSADDTAYTGGHVWINVHAGHGVTLGLLSDRVEEQLKQIRSEHIGYGTEEERMGLIRRHFVKGWGSKYHVMFLVQHTQDPADVGSQ